MTATKATTTKDAGKQAVGMVKEAAFSFIAVLVFALIVMAFAKPWMRRKIAERRQKERNRHH